MAVELTIRFCPPGAQAAPFGERPLLTASLPLEPEEPLLRAIRNLKAKPVEGTVRYCGEEGLVETSTDAYGERLTWILPEDLDRAWRNVNRGWGGEPQNAVGAWNWAMNVCVGGLMKTCPGTRLYLCWG